MPRPTRRSGYASESRPRRPSPVDIHAPLSADLTLRFGGRRLRTRVYWPAATSAGTVTPLTVLIDCEAPRCFDSADLLSRVLCAAAATTVLCLSVRREAAADRDSAVAALGWASEHAGDLGTHPGRLMVAGRHHGGARAAWLALDARDSGWPRLSQQVLVHPRFAGCPLPSDLAGVAPATIIGDSARDDGRRFAALLRRCGNPVEELSRPDRALLDDREEQMLLHADLARTLLGPGPSCE
jgi:hypothetical protein